MSLALGLLALLPAVAHLLAAQGGALALATKPLPVLCLLLLALRHGRGAYPRALAAGFVALSRTPPVPNTPEVDRDNYIPMSLDYLRHGRDWDTRWYWGVGAGWIWRDRTTPDLTIVTAESPTGSVILGRALSVGKGQIVFEGRLELEAIEGGVTPAVALSVGYRHHFTFR